MLESALGDAVATRRPLSFCVLDCDEFKAINDRGGHERGDRVLVELGELISGTLRDEDRAARVGGDEFGLMLPDTDSAAALERAEELRSVLARGLTEAGTTLHVSIGVATYPFDGGTATQLMRAADQALYLAKSSGKDLVVAFRDLGELDTPRRRRPRARPPREPAPGRRARHGDAGLQAVVAESSPQDVLFVLCRALTASLSATASAASLLVAEDRLIDVATYALRDIDLGTESAVPARRLPADPPCARAARAHLDVVPGRPNIDRAEAFILRDLGMNSLLMLPLIVVGGAGARARRGLRRPAAEFEAGDVDRRATLVDAASRRIEELLAEGVDLGAVGTDDAPVQRPIRGEAPAHQASSSARRVRLTR